MMLSLLGSCSCGSVTYRLTSPPLFVHCCHCKDCQRQTGSAFVINALIEADRVEARGETIAVSMPTDLPRRSFQAKPGSGRSAFALRASA